MPDPRTSKPPAVDLGAEGTAAITAVCCSGGGIRSASFNLGALQELAARRVMDDVDMMCAVSGGSYIAASHTLVAHGSHPRPPLDDVYAPGSAEEKWLRGNSRYLLPNVRVALHGGVRLLFGIAANLVLVLSWLFVFAHATGWLLNARGWLSGIAVGRPASSVGSVWLLPAVLAGASVLIALFAGDRSPWPSLSWWCMAAAVVVALVSLAAPRAIQTAYDTGLHDGGNVGTVVRGFGFASPGGCADARAAEPDPAKAICGNTTASTAGAATNAPSDAQGQGAGFLAFVAALAALVRLVLGKLRGEAPATGGTSVLAKVFDTIRRIVLPWVGTIGVIGLLAVFTLRWMADGALAGYTAAELVKVLAAAGVIVAFRFTIDVNHTSMHGFYRDRLAYAYGIERQSTSTVVGRPQVRLSELAADRPDLVLCAAANVNVGIADDEVPPGRDAMSFSFTPHRVGLSARVPAGTDPDLAHVPGRQDVMVSTPLYERVVGKTMTLFGAVALSGAAVSPLMGKMTRPAQRFLFAIADVRLGLWLPNPRLVACAADPSLPRSGLPLVDRLRVRAFRARLLGADRVVALRRPRLLPRDAAEPPIALRRGVRAPARAHLLDLRHRRRPLREPGARRGPAARRDRGVRLRRFGRRHDQLEHARRGDRARTFGAGRRDRHRPRADVDERRLHPTVRARHVRLHLGSGPHPGCDPPVQAHGVARRAVGRARLRVPSPELPDRLGRPADVRRRGVRGVPRARAGGDPGHAEFAAARRRA